MNKHVWAITTETGDLVFGEVSLSAYSDYVKCVSTYETYKEAKEVLKVYTMHHPNLRIVKIVL